MCVCMHSCVRFLHTQLLLNIVNGHKSDQIIYYVSYEMLLKNKF